MPCYFGRIIRVRRVWSGRYGTTLQRHICERRYLSSNQHLGMFLRRINASFKTFLRCITHFPSPLLRKPYNHEFNLQLIIYDAYRGRPDDMLQACGSLFYLSNIAKCSFDEIRDRAAGKEPQLMGSVF